MDSKNDKKDIFLSNIDNISLLNSKHVTFLRDNSLLAFCYKKSVKLLKAIYFITESFNFTEDDRNSLRSLGQGIVKDVIEVSAEKKVRQKEEALEVVEGLEQKVLSLFALLDALSIVGTISPMNVAVFIGEYQQILQTIVQGVEHKKIASESAVFSKDFFVVRREEREEKDHPSKEDNKGHYKTHSSLLSYKSPIRESLTNIRTTEKTKIDGKRQYTNVFNQNSSNNTNISRSQLIIREVREKGSVTIKDVSVLMKDISEKTVQRELIALVSSGVLKKEGERRWSRYFLA